MLTSRTFRSLVLGAAESLGAASLFGLTGPRILLYHGVTTERDRGIFNYRKKFIDTAVFRAHLTWIKEQYEVLPLAEFIRAHNAGSLSSRAMAITFDDGYANNYTDAFPALRELSLPATFFITTGFIDGVPLPVDRVEFAVGTSHMPSILLPWHGNQPATPLLQGGERSFPLTSRKERLAADSAIRSHVKTLADPSTFLATLEERANAHLAKELAQSPYRPMTWGQMVEMQAAGMTFSPHTHSHRILSHLSAVEARAEIQGSRDALAAHLRDPLLSVFAYPNGGVGDFTGETIAILKELGFSAALTTSASVIRPGVDAFHLPRLTMDGASDASRARLATTGAYTRLAGLR